MPMSGIGAATKTVLPTTLIKAINNVGFFDSPPLWAVTLIGGLFITVLSFVIIMSVYGRFFGLYLYTALVPSLNSDAVAITQVWSYIGELVFNMLILVGAVKMSDRVVREMMGL